MILESLLGRACAIAGIVAIFSLGFRGAERTPLDVSRGETNTTNPPIDVSAPTAPASTGTRATPSLPPRPADAPSVPTSVPEVPARVESPLLTEPGKPRSEQPALENTRAAPPAPSTPVWVHIAAYPGNCEVTIDGQRAGTTPFGTMLLPGPHDFRFRWPTINRTRTLRRSISEGDKVFVTPGGGQ